MFYVLDVSTDKARQPIEIDRSRTDFLAFTEDRATGRQDYAAGDIDFVDDSLLNTAPHNKIERQLLNGDFVGLALMSGAIIWSAMGAFG